MTLYANARSDKATPPPPPDDDENRQPIFNMESTQLIFFKIFFFKGAAELYSAAEWEKNENLRVPEELQRTKLQWSIWSSP